MDRRCMVSYLLNWSVMDMIGRFGADAVVVVVVVVGVDEIAVGMVDSVVAVADPVADNVVAVAA